MPQSLESFLKELHHYPEYLQDAQLLEHLSPTQIDTLRTINTLVKSFGLKQVECSSCDGGHFVDIRYENGKYCYICPTGVLPSHLAESEVTTWSFDIKPLLCLVSHKLKLEDAVEELSIPDLWQLGVFTKESVQYYCYYYGGNNFSVLEDFIKNQDDHQRYIVLTSQQPVLQLRNEYNKFLSIPIGHILSFNAKKIFVDKKAFEQHYLRGFRATVFYPESGELRVNGRVIYTAIHTTSEYRFVEALWAKFNEPLSHKIIARYIRTEMKFDYVDPDPKLCHKQRNQIKAKSTAPILITQVFTKTKDEYGELGYIMHDPI
jgi:hypothetical protein